MKNKHDLLINDIFGKIKRMFNSLHNEQELNTDIICETGAIVGVPICKELLN